MYKDIFNKIEKALKANFDNDSEFEKIFNEYKNVKFAKKNDSEYFDIIKFIVFYSGFRVTTVWNRKDSIEKHFPDFQTVAKYNESDVDRIMADELMIRNRSKIDANIINAKKIVELVAEYGSLFNYFASFKPEESLDNLKALKNSCQKNFSYLGDITVYHFLTEIGLNVIKPDRVIQRIFERLGLISDRKDLMKINHEGRKFAKATGYPSRYIDIIVVKYGFMDDLGICLEVKPKCDLCLLTDKCNYFNNKELASQQGEAN